MSQIIFKTFLTYQKKAWGGVIEVKTHFGGKNFEGKSHKKKFLVKNNVISLPKKFFFILGVRTVPKTWGSKWTIRLQFCKKMISKCLFTFFPSFVKILDRKSEFGKSMHIPEIIKCCLRHISKIFGN